MAVNGTWSGYSSYKCWERIIGKLKKDNKIIKYQQSINWSNYLKYSWTECECFHYQLCCWWVLTFAYYSKIMQNIIQSINSWPISITFPLETNLFNRRDSWNVIRYLPINSSSLWRSKFDTCKRRLNENGDEFPYTKKGCFLAWEI